VIDIGRGTPIVLIPGIQGRWEWMLPAVEAVAARSRVISYTLCGDWGSRCRLDVDRGFENYVSQLDEVLERARLQRAALCGVSYGGLIAVHYAARRPDRVSALVLASAPGPRWRPDRRVMKYVRAPRLFTPLFIARSPMAVTREVARALPVRRDRWAFKRRHLLHILRAPFSPARMAQRVRFALDLDIGRDCPNVTAPTLVITGEDELDQIVPVSTTRDYLHCIPGARHVTFTGTGHIGVVTQPAKFAEIVCAFVEDVATSRSGIGHRGSARTPRTPTADPDKRWST
jgi:pimeloyl-ACP methyl ester carboxylesterase